MTDTTNPWRTLSTKPIYDNAWINVREDKVIQPDGSDGIYGVVTFKNKAIGVLPIDDEGFTYLVGQFRYPLGEYSWEIPEGGGPHHEEPLEAARRELVEETGLVAGRWEYLARAHLSNSVSDEEALLYVATELTQQEAHPDGTEKLSVRRLPFQEALDMVARGEITDSMSVIAIQAYALRRRSY